MKFFSKFCLCLTVLAALILPAILGARVSGEYGVFAGLAAAFLAFELLLLPQITRLGAGRAFNTLGALSGTLIIQRALQLVFTRYPALAMISMGFKELDGSVNTMNLNQTATSRLRTIPAVGNFGDAATAFTTTDVSVTLTGFKQVLHTFTPQEVNATDRNLIDEAAEPMAIAIAKYIIAQVAVLWTSRNFARSVTVASGWTYANTLLAIAKALEGAGVPAGRRFGVLGLDPYYKLLEDPLVISALNNPSNGDAIRLGRLPQVAGLMLDDYPDLATNNGTSLTGVTGANSSDIFTKTAHGLVNGDRVLLPSFTGGSSLSTSTIYYVIAASANTFQLATTAGGSAVDMGSDVSAGTVTLQENLVGFAGAPDSTTYVARAPKNPEELMPGAKFPGVLGYVVEPTTGFQVMVNQWIGTDLTLNNRLLWLDGYAKGNGNNGVRLITA